MGEPSGIGPILARMSSGWGVDDPLASAKLFHAWESMVGPEIAAQCRPSSFKGGILKVKTSSQGWASQLRYIAPKMIAKINAELGSDLVKEVKAWVDLKAGSEVSEDPRSKPLDKPAGKRFPQGYPQAEEDVKAAERLVAEIPDEKLAEAAKRALLAGKTRRNQRGSDGIL